VDRQAAARKLVGDLVSGEHIEVRRAEVLGRDLAKLIETLERPPTARELEDWLSEHPQVEELYASTAMLDEVLVRYFAPPKPEPAPAPSQPDLVRQLREDPASIAPYLVYSDWLQEQGDPLGELIALGIAVSGGEGGDEAIARFERYVKQHDARLFGGIPRVRERAQVHWHNGLITSITDGGAAPLDINEWGKLLQLRVCALVRMLSFGSMSKCTESLDEMIAAAAPESLAELHWRDAWPVQTMRRKLGVLGISGHVMPASDVSLETIDTLHLEVASLAPADPVLQRMPVRVLDLRWCKPELLAGLAATELPRLEQLTISLSNCTVGDATTLLLRNPLPALRHLRLCFGRIDAGAFAGLATTPAVKQLSSLALDSVDLDDAAAMSLVPALRTLAISTLDVSGNELTLDALARLRAALPHVTHLVAERQDPPGHARRERIRWFARSRFEAAEEIVDASTWQVTRDGHRHTATYHDYQLFVSDDLTAFDCSCPSGSRPCKHVVALALIASRQM
jgi:uncharacterized protein (TIGR02996 family)